MTNYICINGKKAELTEEQLKALGIELPNASPFERVKKGDKYYIIDGSGHVFQAYEFKDSQDDRAFSNGNYCADKSIMEQRALHETLNRLLWRYSMEHKAENHTPCEIFYDCELKVWISCYLNKKCNYLSPRFDSKEIAENAIEEIVKPFMESHPNFKW